MLLLFIETDCETKSCSELIVLVCIVFMMFISILWPKHQTLISTQNNTQVENRGPVL